MKHMLFTVFAILMVIVLAFEASANVTKTCYAFDLKPYKANFTNSKDINEIVLYHSGFQVPGSKETTYFVDYGFKKNQDLHTFVDCRKTNGNYLKCANEEEAASLGIFINGQDKVSLHLDFIILSDQDESLKVLQAKSKKLQPIPGKAFPCPATTPEDEL